MQWGVQNRYFVNKMPVSLKMGVLGELRRERRCVFLCFLRFLIKSKLHQYACVDESASEIVGHGVIVVIDILYPIV